MSHKDTKQSVYRKYLMISVTSHITFVKYFTNVHEKIITCRRTSRSKAIHPNRYTITEQTSHLFPETFKLPKNSDQDFLNKTTENEIIYKEIFLKERITFTISKHSQYVNIPR